MEDIVISVWNVICVGVTLGEERPTCNEVVVSRKELGSGQTIEATH